MTTVKSLTRQQSIVAFIREFGEVTVEQIGGAFKISQPTVRRDIYALSQQGLVSKARGKITVFNQPKQIDEEFDGDISTNRPEIIERIGQAASEAVGTNEIVFIGPGSIPFCAATILSQKTGMVLQICSLRHASLLRHSRTSTVWVSGGKVDSRTGYVTGGFALDMVRQYHADTAIISCIGINPGYGFLLPDTELTLLLREVLTIARKRILVADSSRINTVNAGNVLPFKYIDQVITDQAVDPGRVDHLRRGGVEVLLV